METQTKKYEMFERTKRTAKKYAGLALLAGCMALPAYCAEQTTVRNNMDNNSGAYQAQVYTQALQDAKSAYNKGLENKTSLSLDEMKHIRSLLDNARKINNNLPKESEYLYEAVDRGLTCTRFGYIYSVNSNTIKRLESNDEFRENHPIRYGLGLSALLVLLGASLLATTRDKVFGENA